MPDAEEKLKAVDSIVERMLEDAIENERRNFPKPDPYYQGKKDALRVVLAQIREDPSIIEDAAF